MRATLHIAVLAMMAITAPVVQAEHQAVVLEEQRVVSHASAQDIEFTFSANPSMVLAMAAPCCDQGYTVKPEAQQSFLAEGCCDQGYEVRSFMGAHLILAAGVLALILAASAYHRYTLQRSTSSWT